MPPPTQWLGHFTSRCSGEVWLGLVEFAASDELYGVIGLVEDAGPLLVLVALGTLAVRPYPMDHGCGVLAGVAGGEHGHDPDANSGPVNFLAILGSSLAFGLGGVLAGPATGDFCPDVMAVQADDVVIVRVGGDFLDPHDLSQDAFGWCGPSRFADLAENAQG